MKIDPERLRRLRKQKGLPRAKLAERSTISERTIQRLENESERGQTTREHTLDRIAKALGVEEGVLTGEMPLPDANRARNPDPERVQIGAQVAPKARLAYDLVRRRYGVNATEIINMAPLFFVLLAEGSFARRRAKLEEAGEAIGRLDRMKDEIGHCIFSGATTVALNADTLEQESIDKADLFGEHLFDDTSSTFVDEPFDPAKGNPFASYLRKAADDLGNPGVIDLARDDLSYGSPLKFPEYDICRDEIDAIANGSSDARKTLEIGTARLAEIPEELTAEDAGEARAAWLEERLPDTYKGLEEGEPMAMIASFEATATPAELAELQAKLEGKLASRRNHEMEVGGNEQ